MGMTIFAAILGAIALLWICSLNWRLSVKVAIYVVVLEGALRKWVLPQASEVIYFLKDGIIFGAYIGYLVRARVPFLHLSVRLALLGWLAATAVIILLEALNPALNSVLVGLLGAKGYLLYVPLAIILPELFRSTEELHRFLRWFLLFCIPVCLLGIAQFFAPVDSVINAYAPSAVEVEVVGFDEGNVRVTGTFPYLAGFSVYLTMNLALLFALLVHQRRWIWKLILAAALLLMVVNSFMTGARSVVLSEMILLTGFVGFSIFEKAPRNRLLSVVLIVAVAICGLVSVKAFPRAIDAFLGRATNDSDSVTERIGNSFVEPLQALNVAGLGGFGAGSTQVACYALRSLLHLGPPAASPPAAENEMLRIMLEIGPFGFIAWYGLRLCFLYLLWQTFRRVRHPTLRYLALAAFLFHLLLVPSPLVTNTTTGVFYWFLAGFAFLLPQLDAREFATRRVQSRRVTTPGPRLAAGSVKTLHRASTR